MLPRIVAGAAAATFAFMNVYEIPFSLYTTVYTLVDSFVSDRCMPQVQPPSLSLSSLSLAHNCDTEVMQRDHRMLSSNLSLLPNPSPFNAFSDIIEIAPAAAAATLQHQSSA